MASSTLVRLQRRVGKRRGRLFARAAATIEAMSSQGRRVRRRERALGDLIGALEATVEALAGLECEERGWNVLRPGYAATYARCRKHTRRWSASGSSKDAHRLRRHVKDLGYQLSLLEPSPGTEAADEHAALVRLGHRLGRLHDCSTLEELTRKRRLERRIPKEDRAEIRSAARAWERELARECLALAEFLFAPTAEAFERRIEERWRAARRCGG